MTTTLDTSNWTAMPAPMWELLVGDLIDSPTGPDAVTVVSSDMTLPVEWVTVRTERGTLDGLFMAETPVSVLAPPEPVASYLLARQPAGYRTSAVSDCTCLYRRLTLTAGWQRLSVDPECPRRH